jgi:uncharacterized protein YcnI
LIRSAFLAACVGAAVLAPLAGAHAIVLPGASRPADFQQYTLTVPTERDVPTVEVDLKIPEGVGFMLVQELPGWQAHVLKRDDRIDEVQWSGHEIPPDHFASFRFIARNPVQSGELVWKVVQRYKDGDVVRWIGAPDSDTPASRTSITETAVPVDVLDVVSGKGPAQTASGSKGSGGGRDGLTLAIAVGAAIVAVLAAAAALLGRRRAPAEDRAGRQASEDAQ